MKSIIPASYCFLAVPFQCYLIFCNIPFIYLYFARTGLKKLAYEVLMKRLVVITNLCDPLLGTYSESLLPLPATAQLLHMPKSISLVTAVLTPMKGTGQENRHLLMQVACFDCSETNDKAVTLYKNYGK